MSEFFPGASVEELVHIYGFTDGIPYYLERVTLPFWDWLDSELSNQTFLGDEMDMLLRIEFRELEFIGIY